MRIARITLNNFRNLCSQTIEPEPHLNVITGDNAQGKTNLLEAIYLVATLLPFRTRSSQELICFGQDQAGVQAELERREQQLTLEVQILGKRKRALVNGKALRSLSGYLGKLNAVLFTPEDLQLPRGAPGERRRLIDQAIVGIWPGYLEVTRSYHKVLQTRNRLLRQRPTGLSQLIAVYEQQLAEYGAKLVLGRRRYLKALSPLVSETFSEIAQSGVNAELCYLSEGVGEGAGNELGEISRQLRSLLEKNRHKDLVRQATSSGPHADDIDFRLDGRSCRSFGSQGQVRTLVLSFKIAQIIDTFQKTGDYPTLLLDDVSSELDSQRNDYLTDFLEKIPCQLFITTARAELIRLKNKYVKFQVVNGLVTRQMGS